MAVAHHIIPLKMHTKLRYKILGHSDLIENVLRYIDIAAMKKSELNLSYLKYLKYLSTHTRFVQKSLGLVKTIFPYF
jgi:hypothetical protein